MQTSSYSIDENTPTRYKIKRENLILTVTKSSRVLDVLEHDISTEISQTCDDIKFSKLVVSGHRVYSPDEKFKYENSTFTITFVVSEFRGEKIEKPYKFTLVGHSNIYGKPYLFTIQNDTLNHHAGTCYYRNLNDDNRIALNICRNYSRKLLDHELTAIVNFEDQLKADGKLELNNQKNGAEAKPEQTWQQPLKKKTQRPTQLTLNI